VPPCWTALIKPGVKYALEPEWEAKFEPHSYGFRPGRSGHDAIGAIFTIIGKQPKYVLDADIAGCFNTIAHAPLLAKLQTFPSLRRTIRAWLKAGVLEDGVFAPTEAGTPQGGCISPLLANVTLHGMEYAVRGGTPGGTTRQNPSSCATPTTWWYSSPHGRALSRPKAFCSVGWRRWDWN